MPAQPKSSAREAIRGTVPKLAEISDTIIYGEIWERPGLSKRDRSLIVVAALVVQGGVEDRLRGHVRWAVEHGATREELEALCSLLAVYAGYPRASVGLETVRDELARIDERGGTA